MRKTGYDRSNWSDIKVPGYSVSMSYLVNIPAPRSAPNVPGIRCK
jgi:hypothetical protein